MLIERGGNCLYVYVMLNCMYASFVMRSLQLAITWAYNSDESDKNVLIIMANDFVSPVLIGVF
jgi:hypothetical protein